MTTLILISLNVLETTAFIESSHYKFLAAEIYTIFSALSLGVLHCYQAIGIGYKTDNASLAF